MSPVTPSVAVLRTSPFAGIPASAPVAQDSGLTPVPSPSRLAPGEQCIRAAEGCPSMPLNLAMAANHSFVACIQVHSKCRCKYPVLRLVWEHSLLANASMLMHALLLNSAIGTRAKALLAQLTPALVAAKSGQECAGIAPAPVEAVPSPPPVWNLDLGLSVSNGAFTNLSALPGNLSSLDVMPTPTTGSSDMPAG